MSRFNITDKTSQQTFVCGEDEYVLYAMQRIGLVCIPVGCKGGGCGVCRINIIQGKADFGRMSKAHVSAEELKSGFALACRVKPKSDLIIECAQKPKIQTNKHTIQLNEVSP